MLRQINFDIGKVPAFIDRILNQFQQQKKTGIFEGIGSEFLINNESIDYSTSGYCKFTIKEGFATIHGGAVYNEEGTQFTPVDLTSGDTLIGLPLTTTSTGSLGIRVDLAKPAGQQASFYYKTTQTLVQQDLNALKTSGVYEFELYKYTSNGSVVTFTKNNTVKIKSVEEDLINIKASILAVVNTIEGDLLFEDTTGKGVASVDLSAFSFADGDRIEVAYRANRLTNNLPTTTPLIKNVLIRETQYSSLIEDVTDRYWSINPNDLRVTVVDRDLGMEKTSKVLSFGMSIYKSAVYDFDTKTRVSQSTDPYFVIVRVKRFKY